MSARGRSAGRIVLLASIAVLAMLIAMRIGEARASFTVALRDPSSFDRVIFDARLARVVLGALAGGALASVGAAFQALLRNPLGDPYALGVSGGAALGATVIVVLGMGGLVVPMGAFVGAIVATAAVIATARAAGRMDAQGYLLAGLVFNAVANAGLAFLRSVVSGAKAEETLALLLGAIDAERPSVVATVGVLVGVGTLALVLLGKSMNLLALGEETAASLGLAVRRAELLIFGAASLIVGGVVSVCGLLPFVGLIVPHYVRAWVGADHRALIPACFFGGAALMVLADASTRLIYLAVGREPSVGAITALIGGPFFFVLIRRR